MFLSLKYLDRCSNLFFQILTVWLRFYFATCWLVFCFYNINCEFHMRTHFLSIRSESRRALSRGATFLNIISLALTRLWAYAFYPHNICKTNSTIIHFWGKYSLNINCFTKVLAYNIIFWMYYRKSLSKFYDMHQIFY